MAMVDGCSINHDHQPSAISHRQDLDSEHGVVRRGTPPVHRVRRDSLVDASCTGILIAIRARRGQNMGGQAFAVVCAWCNRKMTSAPAGATVSHTICPSCLEWSISHPTELVRDVPSQYLGDVYAPVSASTRRG